MEPPPGIEPELVRDEKVKVLKGIAPLRATDVVRGQFRGYRDEPEVRTASTMETFVALRLSINSWRWKDVPSYIRAGKRLAATVTEVVVKLRQAPAVFTETSPPANYFRFRVTPTHTIAISSFVKVRGEKLRGEPVELTVSEHDDPTEMGALRGPAARGHRRSSRPVRAAGLRRGGVAHRRPRAGRHDPTLHLRAGHVGSRRSGSPRRPGRWLVQSIVGRAGARRGGIM